MSAAAINGAIINARPAPRPICGNTSMVQSDNGSRSPNTINELPTKMQPRAVNAAGLYRSASRPARASSPASWRASRALPGWNGNPLPSAA